MSVLRPDLMMKCVIPVIMAGIIAVSVELARVANVVIDGGFPRSTVSSCPFSSPATVSSTYIALLPAKEMLTEIMQSLCK